MGGINRSYIVSRLLLWLLTVFIGATLIFIIPRLSPGDPVAAMVSRMMAQSGYVENSTAMIEAWRVKFGLDGPWYVQYLNFLKGCFTLDFGYSLTQFPSRVDEMIGRAVPWTVGLLTFATLITFAAGNLIGALMGWRKTPNSVRSMLPLLLTFSSIPPFIFGLILMFIFAFWLGWLPFSGGVDSQYPEGFNWPYIKSILEHATLPALAIVLTNMGGWALGMRGMMITTDGEDYMLLAQAKGLRPGRLFFRYAVRNAMLPQLTALALSRGLLVGGSTLVETYFVYPGIGWLLYSAITNNDYSLMGGIVFILILTTATAVLIIDLIYPLIDPRISHARR